MHHRGLLIAHTSQESSNRDKPDWEMVERKRSGLKVSLFITELGIEALTGIEIDAEQ
jgi:hypothetical protein